MGECQSRQALVLISKPCKLGDHIHKLLPDDLKRLVHHDHIRIVPHIAGGCPKMDDPRRFRTLLSVSVHMTHDIMAHLLLPGLRHLIIDIVGMAL